MILGIGTDIIALKRVQEALQRSGKAFMDRVFTPDEQEQARNKPFPEQYLALLFAGKEAVFKTLGAPWDQGVTLRDIEIREGPKGEPLPQLNGRLAQLARAKGAIGVWVSLSFEDDYAIAFAVLEGAS